MDIDEYVVVQFYSWFKFYFRLSWLFVMYDNEFEIKENKIWTKDKNNNKSVSINLHA